MRLVILVGVVLIVDILVVIISFNAPYYGGVAAGEISDQCIQV